MLRYTGKKGEANLIYSNKVALAKSRLKSMPVVDKNMAIAVYADGNIYTINGCKGLEKCKPSYVRIVGKVGSTYKVAWENSNKISEINKEKFEEYFGVKCQTSHNGVELRYEEDR